tara:strand:- start:401 stop:646 length:246 start_codon:yes stop_codon:yes gene_type:complete
MKLINKVKPSVLRALENHVKPRFDTSYRRIIASLTNVERYQDLTVNDIYNLNTFLPQEIQPNGTLDLYWGDYIMQDEYIIK